MGIEKGSIGFILGFYTIWSFWHGQGLEKDNLYLHIFLSIFGFVILVFGLIILRKINNIMEKELKSRK